MNKIGTTLIFSLAFIACRGTTDETTTTTEIMTSLTSSYTTTTTTSQTTHGNTQTTTTVSTSPSSPLYEGSWSLNDVDTLTDTCGFMDYILGEEIEFELAMTDESNFTLGNGKLSYSCALTEGGDYYTYECTGLDMVQDLAHFGFDAEIAIGNDSLGDFDSSSTGSLAFSFDAECNGDDCSMVEALMGFDFPCEGAAEGRLDANLVF